MKDSKTLSFSRPWSECNWCKSRFNSDEYHCCDKTRSFFDIVSAFKILNPHLRVTLSVELSQPPTDK